MKEITKTSRLAGSLERIFRLANSCWFNSELPEPIISIMASEKSYGHYTKYDAWDVKGEGRREINISAGTLNNRPIENVVATMIHEMCHMYADVVLNVQDCSNRGIYHSKVFKQIAEAHGLVVTRSERYGWSHTEPSDALIEWILEAGIDEIKINRTEPSGFYAVGGPKASNGGAESTKPKVDRSGTRRWTCPKCGTIIRSTREVRVICADCMELFVQG